MFSRSLKNVLTGALVLCVLSVFSPPARATGFSLGDADNYVVLYTGAGKNSLSMNNETVNGNVGIGYPAGSNPQVQLNGPLTVNGNFDFAGPINFNNGGGVTVNGSSYSGVTSVQTDLSNLQSLSSTLGAETGTNLTVNLNNDQSQTINASAGTLDANGNRVFNVSSFSFGNGATLTINGNGLGNNVVLNFAANNPQFGGTIVLTGGLTSDEVLFNIPGSNSSLRINTNGAIETGTFLDPNGTISMNHSVLDGRIFGGDSSNMQIVSGAYINDPAVPEPSTVLLIGSGLVGLAAFRKRFKKA
ncbi:MAG: collagen-binding domain-containing protein [Syntrophobacteraceae bacterium]|jgi:hypothetical protein